MHARVDYVFVITSNSFLIKAILEGKNFIPRLNCLKKVQNLTCKYNACNRLCFSLPNLLLGIDIQRKYITELYYIYLEIGLLYFRQSKGRR